MKENINVLIVTWSFLWSVVLLRHWWDGPAKFMEFDKDTGRLWGVFAYIAIPPWAVISFMFLIHTYERSGFLHGLLS